MEEAAIIMLIQSQFIYISTPSAIDVNYTVIPVGSPPASYITGVVSKSAYAEISVGSGDTNLQFN